MDRKDMDIVTPFDQLTSSKNLRMMKLMIPYIAPDSQRFLAIYIRFLELQNTIQYFQSFGSGVRTQTFSNAGASPMEMFQEIAPYMSSEFAETFDQISNMMNMMEMMQSFQGEGSDPMEMFGSMFSQDINEETMKEGDETHERMDEQSSI